MNSTFNQDLSRNSFWHRLNPAVKIIITLLFIVIIFLPNGFFGQLIAIVGIATMWTLAWIPFRILKKVLITWAVMLALLFLINWIAYKAPGISIDPDVKRNIIGGWDMIDQGHVIPFTINGTNHCVVCGSIYGGDVYMGHVWVGSEPQLLDGFNKLLSFNCAGQKCYSMYYSTAYTLSTDVIFTSVVVSIKIGLMIALIAILIATTSEVQLTAGIGAILSPLKLFRIPVNEWAMTIAIAIRYVPSLLGEAQNVLKAQASRGVDYHNGKFTDKAKALVSLIVPMFSIAFHKADDLSNAMEARNYTPRANRTSYRNYYVRYF
ncbi:MAG: energy-coupling factor transporter transmembrane protein EcfT, partial [Malacoplasma sp.]|nr:energy-coupling factor transporter transmembrane protein EcfT [Malacoplasma sp.]